MNNKVHLIIKKGKNKMMKSNNTNQKLPNEIKEIINPTGEWIKMELSFRTLIQLQEYNKSLEKLLVFLCEDENRHVLINLSKKDENFYEIDLFSIMDRINTLCDTGLDGKDRDWEIASNGDFFKSEKPKGIEEWGD